MQTQKILSDCEGAVACQLLFQSLQGTTALDPFVNDLLALTQQRMMTDPNPIELKKQCLGIFMAAMYYNATLTLAYTESHNMTSALVDEICNMRDKFTHEYERRFFIIGLTRMLMAP